MSISRYEKMIRKWDDPVLKQPCAEVQPGEQLNFLDDMRKACRATATGVGLAAPQIGILKRVIFVSDKLTGGFFMINPRIVKFSREREEYNEGCLSYPGIFRKIERPKWITVHFCCQAGVKRPLNTLA